MKTKLKLIAAMVLFGSIGLFIRYIPWTSEQIAFVRAVVGSFFLLGITHFKKRSFSFQTAKKSIWKLLISGALLGLNWIFLFEAYKRTSIAQATLLYYTAPVLVLLFTFVFMKVRLQKVEVLSILLAFTGLWVTMGLDSATSVRGNQSGILFSLMAAGCYAGVMLMNPTLKGFRNEELTFFQLSAAAVTMLPYLFLQPGSFHFGGSPLIWLLVLTIGIAHTGIAYLWYFSSLQKIQPSTVAMMSYIDPLSALFFSFLLLNETLSVMELVGGFIILLGAVLSEWKPLKKNRTSQVNKPI